MLLIYKSLLFKHSIDTELIVLSITLIKFINLRKYEKKAEKLPNQIFQTIKSSINYINACI